jgi:N-methylhydantoinase B
MRQPGATELVHVDVTRHLVADGTEVMLVTAGGGGWGNPWERDPQRVRFDVIEGYVSLESARSDYGVVLEPETFAIDDTATARLRTELASS